MSTNLRYDNTFLRKLIGEALRLRISGLKGEYPLLENIREYFIYLTLDAINDEKLANTLMRRFAALQIWLNSRLKLKTVWRARATQENVTYFIGWISALEGLLSLRHKITMIKGKKISRQAFTRSWKSTAKKLGFSHTVQHGENDGQV